MIMTHAGFPKHLLQKGLNMAKTISKLVGGHFSACYRYEGFVYVADVEVFGQPHPPVHVCPILITFIKSPGTVKAILTVMIHVSSSVGAP